MGSIYRKGRDGYYYYQAYIKNPKTGKMDKRVYHSLGTKNLELAEVKKREYDTVYDGKIKSASTQVKYISIKAFSFSLIGICITILIFIIGFKNSEKDNLKTLNQPESKNLNKIKPLTTPKISKKSDDKEVIDLSKVAILNNIDFDEKRESKEEYLKVVVPKYNIIRIEKVMGGFDQGKIFATVKLPINKDSLKRVCENIKMDYKEFSNLIVCIYSDNEIGESLALGNNSRISDVHKRKAWLAMYTYNPVEGEYFDSDPVRYLGN